MSDDRPPYDATDPRQVGDRKKRERLRATRADGAFKALMGTPDGRLLIWDLLGECGVFRSSWDGHGGRLNFNEGRRDIGLQLLATINRLCPELFGVMMKENSDV
jgi:hypothetical protein